MNILLITQSGNGLARQLTDLRATKVVSVEHARTEAANMRPSDTVIVYDDQLGELDSKLIEQLKELGALVVWQAARKVTEETVYYHTGVDVCCSGDTNRMLMSHLCKMALIIRFTEKKAEEEADGAQQLTSWLVMDELRHEVRIGGKEISLTAIEFSLMYVLFRRPGLVKSRDHFMEAAYPDKTYVDDRTIDSHIKRIRKKIRLNVHPEFNPIETLYGLGYRGLAEVPPGIFGQHGQILPPEPLAAE